MSLTTTVDRTSIHVSTQTNGADQQNHDVDAVFNCLKDGISRGEMLARLEADPKAMNEIHENVQARVRDVNGCSQKFSLFENGFEFLKHESRIKGIEQFKDHEKVKEEYWPECVELIKKKTGAQRVVMMHTMMRSSAPQPPLFGPAYRVHCDTDAPQAVEHVHGNLKEEGPACLEKRFLTVNLWRPIETVRRDPLAIVDLNSRTSTDLVPLDIVRPFPPFGKQTIMAVKAREGHKWYYKYGQKPDEPVMFLQWDNGIKNKGWGQTPHSSFHVEDEGEFEERLSIEARALCFFDDEIPKEGWLRSGETTE